MAWGVGDVLVVLDALDASSARGEVDEASRWAVSATVPLMLDLHSPVLARAHGYLPLLYDQEQDGDMRCCILRSVAQILERVSFLIHTDGRHEAPLFPELVALVVPAAPVVPVEPPMRDTHAPERVLRDDRVDSWTKKCQWGSEGSEGESWVVVVLWNEQYQSTKGEW